MHDEEQKRARERIALFPANAELFFVARDIWVVSILVKRAAEHVIDCLCCWDVLSAAIRLPTRLLF
jgi:hypothetical protein